MTALVRQMREKTGEKTKSHLMLPYSHSCSDSEIHYRNRFVKNYEIFKLWNFTEIVSPIKNDVKWSPSSLSILSLASRETSVLS